jgi:hypothetical protein
VFLKNHIISDEFYDFDTFVVNILDSSYFEALGKNLSPARDLLPVRGIFTQRLTPFGGWGATLC